MVQKGYTEWDAEHGVGPTAVDGQELAFAARPPVWRRPPGPGVLRTLDGTQVTQELVFYADAPKALRPFAASVEISFLAETDLFAFVGAVEAGVPVLWYPGSWWHVDRWSVPLGGAGRTTWRTSRRLPVEVPGMDQAPAPPELVVVVDGEVRGDVTIPSSNDGPSGWCAEIVTPDLSAEGAQLLELRYPPEYLVRFADVELDGTTYNRLTLTADLEEVLRGVYTDLA